MENENAAVEERQDEKKNWIVEERSYTACLSKGFEFFTANFKRLLTQMWPLLLVNALLSSVIIDALKSIQTQVLTDSINALPALTELSVISLLTILSYCVLLAQLMHVFNVYQKTGLMPTGNLKGLLRPVTQQFVRTVKWVCLVAPLTLAVVIIVGAVTIWTSRLAGMGMVASQLLTCLIGFIVLLVVTTPLYYSYCRYLLNPDDHLLKMFLPSLSTGFRHFGLLFATSTIASMLIAIFSLLVSIPTYIVILTTLLSADNVVNGDPSGMPANMGAMVFVVNIVCFFVSTFVKLTPLGPIVFAYGSIEKKESIRK